MIETRRQTRALIPSSPVKRTRLLADWTGWLGPDETGGQSGVGLASPDGETASAEPLAAAPHDRSGSAG
jgi:hypothetical protein